MGACLAKEGSEGQVGKQVQGRDVAAVAESRVPKLSRESDYGDGSKIVQGEGQAYKVVKLLGSGSEANTWLVEEISTRRKWAMKLIKLPLPTKFVTSILREIKLQSELGEGHDNIITPEELVLTSHYLGLVMELAPGGSLTAYITKLFYACGGVGLLMPEDEARYFFKQMLQAVSWCHEHHVVHRDLKLDNTLLSGHNPPYIKLCDFGFARDWHDADSCTTVIGTPDYMAPEITGARVHKHRKAHYDGTKADVWALGVIVCVMLLGKFPFEGDSVSVMAANDAVQKVWMQQQKGQWSDNPLLQSQLQYLSPECRDMLNCMFDLNEKSRIDMEGLRKHPWTNGPLRPHFEASLQRLAKEQSEVERKVREGIFRSKERDAAITSMMKLASSEEIRRRATEPITHNTTFKIHHRISLRTVQESYPVFTRESLRAIIRLESESGGSQKATANPLAAGYHAEQ